MAKLLHTASTSSSCSSVSLPKQRNHSSFYSFDRISVPFRSESSISLYSTGRLSPSICCSYSSWKTGSWISNPSPVLKSDSSDGFEVKATSGSDSTNESDVAAVAVAKSKMAEMAVLGLLFGIWYLFNIYFNIYNKQVLEVFPNPVTLTAVQLAVGTAMIFFSWALNLHKWPNISRAQLVAILPLAVMHTLGNFSTNMSLGKVSVSFTHTIKAMEPFFTVVLSTIFLGEESLDNITLFSIITIMSFFIFTPVALLVGEVKFTPAYLQSAVAYMILQRVSPVTHSVGNCVKRVVVIVSSIFFFRTPVSLINAIGTAVALAGVFLYSQVKRIKPKTV
ncbi:protein of unknown function DUF250 [Cynara cardunculus var. scolymus]|uniref:Sugar phosphate transporter domain-containing protein n=1 Tax=Cynara cardunculus var. scolymus TaxID=59895 RepID=A0A103XWM0_CYNCS|nr:protein of unknown function DUF250 [Cynara cardunculus var. scolymus]